MNNRKLSKQGNAYLLTEGMRYLGVLRRVTPTTSLRARYVFSPANERHPCKRFEKFGDAKTYCLKRYAQPKAAEPTFKKAWQR